MIEIAAEIEVATIEIADNEQKGSVFPTLFFMPKSPCSEISYHTNNLKMKKQLEQKQRPLAFKFQVVSIREKEDLNYIQAQRKYDIQGTSTVLVWIRKHGIWEWKELPTMSHKKHQNIRNPFGIKKRFMC